VHASGHRVSLAGRADLLPNYLSQRLIDPVLPSIELIFAMAAYIYPKDWERHLTLQDERGVCVRPIRPEDEALYGPFFAAETAEDLRWRFFASVKDFSHKFIARLTQVDYAKAMAFIALDEATGEMLGVARLHDTADNESGEYAILIRSDLKSEGLGWQLMQMIIAYARAPSR
jgi:acetyltransferase